MADPGEDVTHALGDITKQSELDAAILGALQNAKPSAAAPVPNLQELIDKFRRLPTPRSTSLERIRYFGDYLLLAELGRGGMGIVYRARQVSLNRDVALKMLLANQFTAGELLTRFRLEAETAATLDHPHIVPVYEVGEYDKQPYYCMKFIEGTNLAESKLEWQVNAAELTRSARQVRSRRVAELVEKLARGMHYAHQRGILHRDLKPSNILLDTAREPHITDFGLAKLLDAPTEVTLTGAVLGTPSYMAPEQAAGSKVITTAVDVYGLGAVLYELMTGRAPFKGESSAQTLRLVLETEPKPPRAFVPDIDRDLESICLKCIAREKNDRYASADALATDLQRYLRNETTLARPSSWRERAWKWSRRNPTIAALIASSLLAVMIFVIGLTTSNIVIARARSATEKALEHQQQANYIKTVNIAHRDLQEGDPTRTLDMLASCDPKRRDWEWNYLKRTAEANYRKVTYPSDNCLDLAFSPNSKYLAALVCKTSKGIVKPQFVDVQVALFDPGSYQLQRTLDAPGVALDPPSEIEWWRPRLRISPGGHFVAFYATFPEGDKLHGVVRCFDGTKDWQPMKLKMDLFRDQVVMGIVFEGNRLYALVHDLVAVNDRDTAIEFRVVDVATGNIKFKFTDSNRQSSPQLNRDSSIMVLAGGPQNVIDFKTGESLPFGDLRQTYRYISNMVISSDDKYIASVDNYGRIYIFDYASRKKLREIEAHFDGAFDLSFSGLNREIVSVGGDGALKRWRVSDGELLGKLNIGESLSEVAVHPQTGEVIAPDNIGTLAVWNPSESNALQPRNPRDGAYFTQQLKFCENGKRVFALESAMHLAAWDASTRERIQAIEFHKFGGVLESLMLWQPFRLVTANW